MNKEEIRKDILAFADDESDVIIEPNGDILYYKNGTEQLCSIKTESNITKVHYNGEILSYNDFISKKLARLDVFSQKIIEKRKKLDEFIDGPAHLYTNYKSEDGKALELLKKECDNFFEFGSKIAFITADAGHGKSILLKQFQYYQAERYSRKESNYLFWHIDLQGRDLVRLAEAIMYDLGELRMPGLYYPSIISLVQKRMIVLAIDGFDELAAEIGGTNAVSSLSNFINQMNGNGTLVCASRRTFFDTGDYLKKTNIINREKDFDIFFNEIKLKDWKEEQVIEYFDLLGYDEPKKIYQNILVELQNDANHPILTRPFLLAKLEKALDSDATKIPTFFSNKKDCDDGVAIIVESFMNREVNKWKDRNGTDQETGKPYLTFDQHIQLLSSIAKEMWESKRDYITKEEIEFYTVMLVDDWGLSEDIKRKVVRFSSSHAFLIPKDDNMNYRRFDHEEFKYYFLARAIADMIERCVKNKEFNSLRKFLYIDQLPDSVATYCFNYVNNKKETVENILDAFTEMVNSEWKPTYLQINIGTLVPFLLHNLNNSPLKIKAKISYSSLVFESKSIKNVTFENGEFVNISIRNTFFENVEFVNCNFNEIKFEELSNNTLSNVRLNNSEVKSIIILSEGQVKEMAYAPNRIQYLLKKIGILSNDDKVDEIKNDGSSTAFKKLLLKFIFKYNQQMIQYEKNIKEDKYIGNDFTLIFDEIIPLLEKYNVIEKVETKASRQNKSNAWRLLVDIEELLKCDKEGCSNKYSAFWKDVNNHF